MVKTKNTCLIGLQYGDEGKGSFSHFLSSEYDVFVRYNGGGNAGHTVFVDEKKIVTHFLPVGIIKEDSKVVLGNGMVINPKALILEIEQIAESLNKTFEEISSKIFISNKAHIITSKMIELDAEREKSQKIGTTKTGVGPAYESKANRTGMTIGQALSQKPLSSELKSFKKRLGARVFSTEILINQWSEDGLSLFFEGAQGVLLDLDFGQYPYVTSSNCIPSSVGSGAGFDPRKINNVIGVIKPYTTRVGAGPFPTKMSKKEDEDFRQRGLEFGATTGRPRLCGWLDLPSIRYAIQIAGVDEILISKMDLIINMSKIKVCVGYSLNGYIIDGFSDFPCSEDWSKISPIYEDWLITDFISNLKQTLGVPVTITSWGPNSSDKIFTPNHTGFNSFKNMFSNLSNIKSIMKRAITTKK